MGLFGKLFRKKGKPPSAQDSLQSLQDTEELLIKKQEFLEVKIHSEIAIAKAHGSKNKRLALQALRRKKNFEKQLEHIDGVLNTIAHQKDALENATLNAAALQAMSSGAKALKEAYNSMDADKVHELMEDIAEQRDLSDEISAAIRGLGVQSDVDDDELLKELDEMYEEDELSEKIPEEGVPSVDLSEKLPAAPKEKLEHEKKIAAQKKRENDDLAELENWAAS